MNLNGGDAVNTHDYSNDSDLEDSDDVGPTFNDDNVDDRRDQIAQAMWVDYQKVCEERRNIGMDGLTDSESDDNDELDAML